MVPENKQNRRYKQINFIGLQNNHHTPLIWRPQASDQGSAVGGLLSVSPPEEHHKRRTFCRREAIQERVTAVL
jgi:hypothetical protein